MFFFCEEFEDTKGSIRIRKSKDRQYNDQKKRTKGQTTIYKNTKKAKDRGTRNPLNTGGGRGEIRCSGRVAVLTPLVTPVLTIKLYNIEVGIYTNNKIFGY